MLNHVAVGVPPMLFCMTDKVWVPFYLTDKIWLLFFLQIGFVWVLAYRCPDAGQQGTKGTYPDGAQMPR